METGHGDCLVLPDADARDPILGYCVISRAADEGEIVSVAIAPSKRGRGYGSLLLTDVFALEKEKGISTIFLEVRQSNAPAMALYEKIGFYPVGIRPKYYADTKEDARIYRKDL